MIRLAGEVARGAPLEVPREALPPTGEDEYYAFQLVGLEVVEEVGAPPRPRGRGRFRASRTTRSSSTAGLLLPLIGDCVRNIDLDAGRILVAPGFSDPE